MTRDELLDELFDRLAGTGAAGRRALAEIEGHLEDAIVDAQSRGLTEEAAEAEAVARFGSPETIARGLTLAHEGIGAILRPTFVGVWVAGIIGLLAIGVSGLVSELLGRVGSPGFVAGDRFGVTYTAQRCAEYLQLSPGSKDCASAAAMDHWGEVVVGRVGAGVLGLLALGVYLLARHSVLRGARWQPPMLVVVPVVVTVFAVAALILGAPELVVAASGTTSGTGVGLADGAVSLLVAVGATGWLLRRARERSAGA